MAEEGFLARWSRRKRGLEGDAAGPDASPAPLTPVRSPESGTGAHSPGIVPPDVQDAVEDATAAKPEPEPPFDPASLPPVESLTVDSDLAPFLRPRVPAALRQAALRRIWQLDPAIRDFIGPADYAWDYNSPGGVPGFDLEMGEDVARRLLALLTEPTRPRCPEPGSGDPSAPGAEARDDGGVEAPVGGPGGAEAAAQVAGGGVGSASGGGAEPAADPLAQAGRVDAAAAPVPISGPVAAWPAASRPRHGGARPA